MAEITKPSFLSNTWAQDGNKVEPSNSKKDIGWVPEIPTAEMFNWIDNRQDEAIAHFNQMGIPLWDTSTEYIANKSFTYTSVGNIFIAKQTHTNQNPETDTSATYWQVYSDRQTTAVTLATGYSLSFTHPLTFKATTGNVLLNGIITSSGSPTSLIGTLPVTHRPSSPRIVTGITNNGPTSTPAILTIGINGEMELVNTPVSAGRFYYFSGAFPL